MPPPNILTKTWDLAFASGARRSGPPQDTTPDVFSFVSQTGTLRSATITSAPVTITGITAATSVTVSGGTWSKNGGAFTSSAGTVVSGDSVRLRHTSSANYSTVTQSTLTVGGVSAIFASTTEANPNRLGVVSEILFETTAAVPDKNPETSPVGQHSSVDGYGPWHLAQSKYGASTGVRNLVHVQVDETSVPIALEGSVRACRLQIFPEVFTPTVDYTTGGFQPANKPRCALNQWTYSRDIVTTYRQTWWLGYAVYLPADYEEEGVVGEQETLVQCHSDPENGNNWEMQLYGKSGGGAQWRVALNRADEGVPTTNNNLHKNVAVYTYDVTAVHLGKWNIHVFQFDIDNRMDANGNATGTPIFRWWSSVWNGTTLSEHVQRANTTTIPYGYDSTNSPTGFGMTWDLYKGGWRASRGYTGTKTNPIWLAVKSIRIGDSSSNYSSMHPLQVSAP